MALIGGFDPSLGVRPLVDGRMEIGRSNLPLSSQMLPDSLNESATTRLFGNLSGSSLLDSFAPFLALELRHRELLSPDVFFESLGEAAAAFRQGAGGEGDGQPKEGPLVEAARVLEEILGNRELCEILRNLVMKA